MPQDFSGQNLRGASFKGQNLTGANFTGADICGTNFAHATLNDANFTKARAGLPKRWIFFHSLLAALMAAFGGGLAGYSGNWCATYFNADYVQVYSSFFGISVVIMTTIAMLILMRQGITRTAIQNFVMVSLLAGMLVGTIAPLFMSQSVSVFAGVVAAFVAISVAGAGSSAIAGFIMLLLTFIQIRHGWVVWIAVGLIVAIALVIAQIGLGATINGSWDGLAVSVAMPPIIAGVYGFCQGVKNDPKFSLVVQLAIWVSAIGGTNFHRADLTGADFSQAKLKSSILTDINLKHTCWYQAHYLSYARFGRTILSNPAVLQLLVSGNGEGQSYVRCNFRGAYLTGAHLTGADFTEADLSEATLTYSQLQDTNLSRVRALHTQFQSANLTGACIESWNIDSTTCLDSVICDYIYQRNSQQERRPHSGLFAAGEFTKLFQELLNTIDLIFRNGVDWRAFVYSFNQLQIKHQGMNFAIQSIENKGDGVMVIRVDPPLNVDKAALTDEIMGTYAAARQELEAQYQQALTQKDIQISQYQKKQADLLEVTRLLASRPLQGQEFSDLSKKTLASKVILLRLDRIIAPTSQNRLPVTLRIGWEKTLPFYEGIGELPSIAALINAYQNWQTAYRKNLTAKVRLEISDAQITNISRQNFLQDCEKMAVALKHEINQWLNAEVFRAIKEEMISHTDRTEHIRVIIQTEDLDLRRIPYQLWDFFETRPHAEAALSMLTYERFEPPTIMKPTVNILAIFGDSANLDLQTDRTSLAQLPNTKILELVEPTREELTQTLWSRPWDILFFAGHSSSPTEDSSWGNLRINRDQSLCIADFKNALKHAISQGLKLAIFNSCDGLGLADYLADLQIPQTIVMREPVPDPVAHVFLQNFLAAFSENQPLYKSIRIAREQLQALEDNYPCATWLPVIYQNPAASSLNWSDLWQPQEAQTSHF
jgi:uncharacterized protein YjbI with pentapeptide repeats